MQPRPMTQTGKRTSVQTEKLSDVGPQLKNGKYLTSQVNQLLSDRIDNKKGSFMGEAELANQKIIEESDRNEWEESMQSQQLMMSQSLRHKADSHK